MQQTHFRKNLVIMGGLLLMLAYSGPGKWALGAGATRRRLRNAKKG